MVFATGEKPLLYRRFEIANFVPSVEHAEPVGWACCLLKLTKF